MSTRVSNDGPADDGTWGHLIRLQSEYQARLTEETLRYLRSLQAAFSPRPPGTVVQANGLRLVGAGQLGADVVLAVEIDNRQRAHTPVHPSVSPLVSDAGTTWYPSVDFEPPGMIIGPDQTQVLAVTVQLPDDLPPDTYRGSLLLQGFLFEGIPIEVTVEAVEAQDTPS